MDQIGPPRQYATFPVIQPDRERLRRLIEEDKRKKKKIILIVSIPCALIIAGLVVALLLIFLGGGMSPAEYREKVMPEHDKVMSALEDVKIEWKDAYYDVFINNQNTDGYKQDCANTMSKVDEASAVIDEAVTLVEGITPPKEAEAFRVDLLAFYGSAREELAKAKGTYEYLPALAEVVGAKERENDALGEVPTSSMSEELSYLDRYMQVFQGCRDRLAALAPATVECQEINNKQLEFYNTMVGLDEKFYAAAVGYNLNVMETTSDQIKAEEDANKQNYPYALQPIGNFATEYALFIQKGKDLTAQLEDLGVKK